ncbi:serine/threonine protein kinase [Aspergillus candidus]|uniref:Mechanosensitive ion channel-domain-containing protein n=1 Tax=Aspergillus candidus TaxID=41067 RepID=A0A2I2FFN5_ASPCN|nr:Mechanosensitive ion channel-domain-containing protein [Aspergillus candidus]PLB39440.1 Mechanosensitive ion channel-domain-containing protein [Aspergillus candidus]
MGNPNDVMIDIPLSNVGSRGQTGARNPSVRTPRSPPGQPMGYQPPGAEDTPGRSVANEKTGLVSDAAMPGVAGGRRRITGATGAALEDPADGTVTRMGRIYQAVLNFSLVTRYLLYILPLAILLAIPIIVGATVAPHAAIGGVSLPWFFFWFEIVWVSLWISKLAARGLPYVFQFLSGIVSSGTRKYALILRNLETPLATVLWAAVSLVTFFPIMALNPEKKSQGDKGVKGWEKSIKNILFALFVCSLIFLAEKAVVQLISISYHRKQFDRKIQESKRKIQLVGMLYDASRTMFPMYCREFRDDDAAISDSLLGSPANKGPGHLRSSSSAPLRLIREVGHNVGRFGNKVTAAFGDVAHEITGKEVFNPTAAHSIVTQALERRRSSEALARRIWMSFVIEGREALFPDDISEVLGAGKETDADECFHMLDQDTNGDISLDEMVMAVAEIGRQRKSLNHSMHDVDQAIHVLDNLLMSVAFIVGVLVFVSFVTSGFGTVIAAGATSLLSLSFVFSTTAQEVLGSCIFLFVKHPFDIGDRVEIDSKPYVVDRISLLFSVFRCVTDHRLTQVPNAVLNTLWIDNFTRSNAMHETLTVPVHFDTTFSNIQMLRDEMERFVRDKDNCRDFQPELTVDVTGVGDMDKLELSVSICHKSNWANDAVRASRRSKFMCALIATVRKIHIRGPVAADDAGCDSPSPSDDKSDDASSKDTSAAARAAGASEGVRRLHTDLADDESRSTGFDVARSTGSLHRRGAGSTPSISLRSGATYPDPRRSRSVAGGDVDNYQTPAASPGHDPAAAASANYVSLARTPSPAQQGPWTPFPTATGGVPILSHPTPPRRASNQYPPPPTDPYHQHYEAPGPSSAPGQAVTSYPENPYLTTQQQQQQPPPSELPSERPGENVDSFEEERQPESIPPRSASARQAHEMPGAFRRWN